MSPVVVLPQMVIEANGGPLSASGMQALGAVRVQQRLSLPTQCELTFRAAAGPLEAAYDLTPGTSLRLSIAGFSDPLFVGEVTAVEHRYEPANGLELRVRAYDLLHRLRKRQQVRAHVQVTLRDLAQELTGDLGVTLQVAAAGPIWPRLIQHRQSDLELLVEVAERCGLYLSLWDDVLHLLTLEGTGEALPLTLGKSLLEMQIEVNGDPACRTVEAAGWNPLQVEIHRGRAANPRSGRRVDAEVPPSEVGGSGQRDLVNEATLDDDHAEGLAQAELDHRVAREVTLWGVADGDPRLRPGTPVEIDGVLPSLAGRYVLTAVTHILDEQMGFVSEISSTPPTSHPRPRGAVATLAVVTNVGDPDNLGRVKVSLSTYGDVETEWLEVLSAGAGVDKGLMVLPDIGDTVLVLLAHEDPSQGIVLGGLYGTARTPDPGVDGGVVKRYTLLTRGGQRIQLDDARGLLRVENSQGSYCELSPDRVRLHAAVNLEIEAPGKSVVIRGQAIDFQRG